MATYGSRPHDTSPGDLMDWVKLASTYYLDPKVAALPDAETESMFVRSIAYCGSVESDGFVSEGVLLALARRRHHRCAANLVAAGLWQPVEGGWVVTRWQERQAELMGIVDKRRRDAQRKREARSASADSPRNVRGQSEDASADSPPNVRPREGEKRREDAPPTVVRPPTDAHTRDADPRPVPAKPLPDDWQPNEEHQLQAARYGLDLAAEAFTFRQHALAHDRRLARPDAAFAQWLANGRTRTNGRANETKPSTTDTRIAQAQALKTQLRGHTTLEIGTP